MKKNKGIIKFLVIFCFFIISTNIALANATPSIVPQGSGYNDGSYQLNDLLKVGVNISEIILGIVGSLTLLMFVYGGVMMLISSGNSEQVTKAKGILMAAIIGLIIVFASYTIIQFVMSALGINDWTGDTSSITQAFTIFKV
ncbi:MAG TPA: hypothetical protein PLE28_03090 [bacterium]|nr:hypothetical protein [bacterium]